MVASAAKPTKCAHTAQKKTRKLTIKQELILKTKSEHPDLNTVEIGVLADCNHSTVVRTLARYGINLNDLQEYKSKRADIFAGLQHRLLASCTDEDIKKAPMGSRVLAAAQLYDKERLELDKSTSNVGVLVDVIKRIQAQDSC